MMQGGVGGEDWRGPGDYRTAMLGDETWSSDTLPLAWRRMCIRGISRRILLGASCTGRSRIWIWCEFVAEACFACGMGACRWRNIRVLM